jgi:hypothetical protein
VLNAGMNFCGARSYHASIELTGLARSLAR